MFRMFCCDCTLCEPRDDWNLEDEAREGERGAGWLYKKAKGSDLVWSKRYFVITNEKLMYFTERDRLVMKGEIVLAGATAVQSTVRADSKKCFYFTISHPQCGSRDFYAKTRNRRSQWMSKINDVSAELMNRSMTGKLLKQGGLSKNIWQERWCICTGTTLDYFDAPTDNQSKGSLSKYFGTDKELFANPNSLLDIVGAKITPMMVKDKFCFEIAVAIPGKKGNKKYIFGADKEFDRDRWVEMLTKAAANAFNLPPAPEITEMSMDTMNSASNPIHLQAAAAAGNNNNARTESSEEDYSNSNNNSISLPGISISSNRSSAQANEISGYLLKKSPNVMKGWQKRYFKTQVNGDLSYYKSVS